MRYVPLVHADVRGNGTRHNADYGCEYAQASLSVFGVPLPCAPGQPRRPSKHHDDGVWDRQYRASVSPPSQCALTKTDSSKCNDERIKLARESFDESIFLPPLAALVFLAAFWTVALPTALGSAGLPEKTLTSFPTTLPLSPDSAISCSRIQPGTHPTPSLPAPLCSHFSVAAARKVRGFCWRPGSDDATLVLGSRFLYRRTGLLLCHAGKHHPLSNFGRSWLLLPDGSLLGVRGRNCGSWKLATPCPPAPLSHAIELGNFPLQDGLLLSQLAGHAVALFPAYHLFATCVLPQRHIRACYSWARGAWQRGCRLCGG